MAKAIVKRETTTVVTARAREAMNIEFPPLPEALEGKINPRGWLATLVAGIPYVEPDEELISREMLLNVILEQDDRKALLGSEFDGLQDVLDDYAGATTGPILITDLFVLKSDKSETEATYVILEYISQETGQVVRTSTGARAVQAGIIRHLVQNIWPIPCQIVRDKATDQGGRHLLKIWPVDA